MSDDWGLGLKTLSVNWSEDVSAATSIAFYERVVALSREMLPAAEVRAIGLTHPGHKPHLEVTETSHGDTRAAFPHRMAAPKP